MNDSLEAKVVVGHRKEEEKKKRTAERREERNKMSEQMVMKEKTRLTKRFDIKEGDIFKCLFPVVRKKKKKKWRCMRWT